VNLRDVTDPECTLADLLHAIGLAHAMERRLVMAKLKWLKHHKPKWHQEELSATLAEYDELRERWESSLDEVLESE
jgi:hypothetical protein